MEEIWLNKNSRLITNYYLFLTVLLIIIISLLFYKYDNIKTIYGQINEEKNIVINVDEEVIPFLEEIKINNKLEKINILSISKEYVLDSKYNKYKVLIINQKLKNVIINNLVKIDLILPKKNILERIKIWN